MQQFKVFRALGLAISAWFRNFIPFTLITALLYSPAFIYLATVDPMKAKSSEDLVSMTLIRPIYIMVGMSLLVAPMLTYRVIQEMNGTKVSMMTSIKYGVRGILPALILAVVVNLLQLIPLGGIVASVFTCVWFVAAPAAVAERLSPFAALSRSGELTSGRRWGIFGLNFLLGIIMVVVVVAVFAPLASKGSLEALNSFKSSAIIVMIVMGVFQMFLGIVEAVSYALLRQDKEGITNEQLAAVFD